MINFAMEHIIVIGGTGILRGVCRQFSQDGKVVSVVARSRDKLVELVKETRANPGIVNPVMVDYTNSDQFKFKLHEAVTHLGPPTIVINLMPPMAEASRRVLFDYLNENDIKVEIFDIFRIENAPANTPDIDGINQYHRVIIGWKNEASKRSRFNEDEIAIELIAVLEEPQDKIIIGQV